MIKNVSKYYKIIAPLGTKEFILIIEKIKVIEGVSLNESIYRK